jgi:hypothetical protein
MYRFITAIIGVLLGVAIGDYINLLIKAIVDHPTSSAMMGFWIFSVFVSALPTPNGNSTKFYQFFFALMHGFAGSAPRVLKWFRFADKL